MAVQHLSFGYLIGEFPATYIMQNISLTKYFAIMSMLWGLIEALLAACPGFASLAALRFLLGFIEVCTAPAVIYITTSWYTQSEQVTRVAIWFTTSGLASVFGGFLAWAFYQADSFRWEGLFVFYGILTFAVGVVMYFFLASSPTEARWLSEREKVVALERLRGSKLGTEVWKFKWSQLREAFADVRLYLVFLLLVSTGLPNGGVSAFGQYVPTFIILYYTFIIIFPLSS
jgi:ACS family allantoate permease-like MFS transporter